MAKQAAKPNQKTQQPQRQQAPPPRANQNARNSAPPRTNTRNEPPPPPPQTDYDNTNHGALFKNNRKEAGSKSPDMSGTLNVNGLEYWISAWSKVSRENEKYLSVAINEKESGNSENVGRGRLDLNDRKSDDKHPDMVGSVKIENATYDLAAWFNVGKQNQDKYISITIDEGNGQYDESTEEMPWDF